MYDPFTIKILNNTCKKKKKLGYNQSYDIWYIGSICYEMLTGKKIFDSDNMDDYVKNTEKGIYYFPNTTSYELISFINRMLQQAFKQIATAAELSKHDFLNKDIKQFKKITDPNISNELKSNWIGFDSENNKCILSIYNKYEEFNVKLGNDKNKEPEESNDKEKESKGISDKMDEKISETSKEDSDKNK